MESQHSRPVLRYTASWRENVACRVAMGLPPTNSFATTLIPVTVRPRWIRYSDYDQNPPLIQEFTFPNPV